MTYTSIQFIGYAIDTAPRENLNGTYTYLGLQNPRQDIEARCQLMQRAMNTAYDKLQTVSPPSNTTLTVFQAPEFFLRGSIGAYEMDDVQFAIKRLQEIAADPKWTGWLLSFGTIVGFSSPHLPSPPYEIDPDAIKEAYNFALIQEGGTEHSGPAGARVVMKELQSGIDFISEDESEYGVLVGESMEHLLPVDPSGPGREWQKLAYDGAGLFAFGDMTWAAEICLDHLEGRLVRSPQLPGQNKIQIQLVPSCGAQIDPGGVVAEAGGYVFNVDGHNGAHAELRRAPFTLIRPLDTYAVPNDPVILENTSPPTEVPISELYRHGAGDVVIYGALSVPPAETVKGTVVPLRWDASDDYRFDFSLVYDDAGALRDVLCMIVSQTINFQGNKYFIPLKMKTQDRDGLEVFIDMKQIAGTGGYSRAVWCKIDVSDFDFEGVAFQFNDIYYQPPKKNVPPETAW